MDVSVSEKYAQTLSVVTVIFTLIHEGSCCAFRTVAFIVFVTYYRRFDYGNLEHISVECGLRHVRRLR